MKANIQIAVAALLYTAVIILSRILQAYSLVFTAEMLGICLISFLWFLREKNRSLKPILGASAGSLLLMTLLHFPTFENFSDVYEIFIHIPFLIIGTVLPFLIKTSKSKSFKVLWFATVLGILAGFFFMFPFYIWEINSNRKDSELKNSLVDAELLRFDTTSQLSLKDKILVIGVWNSKCGYCKKLLRHMQNLSESDVFKSDTSTVFVALNDGKLDSYEFAVHENKLIKELNNLHFWYSSDKKFYKNLNFLGAPTMIIMKNGKIRSVVNGYILDAEYFYTFFIEREIRKVENQ
jgi:thiol-disulfide isomerase/thioredoxin